MSVALPKAREDRALLGIGLTLLAFFQFSFVDASVKWLTLLAYPALQLAFFRYFAHAIISGVRLARNPDESLQIDKSDRWLVVLRGVLILGSTVLNFIALKYLPLTLTSTILFSSPIIVCLLSGTMLGERVGKWRWLAILFGFIGVLIAIRPFHESFHWATLVSLAAVTCFAFYLVLTRQLAGKVGPDTMQFGSGAVGFIALLPFTVMLWRTPDDLLQWALLTGLGIFAWAGHEMLTRAYRYADASVLTPYSYSFMIYLTVWSIVLFDHYPDRWTLIGAAIIVTSGLIIWVREKMHAERQPK